MRSSYTPPTPAALLFENLAYDCKTDEERNAAINKILATTGGDDTIAAARDYANEKITALDTTIAQLEYELDDLADRGITKLPVCVLANHNLKLATHDKVRFTPLYTAALAALEHAIEATNQKADLSPITCYR